MMSGVLSAEEIDSLLQALADGEIDSDEDVTKFESAEGHVLSQREIDLVVATVQHILKEGTTKISKEDNSDELKENYRSGFQDGYNMAWAHIEDIFKLFIKERR